VRWDIVITDFNMPEMGCVLMAEKIHAIKTDTKFIVITGNNDPQKFEKEKWL
jgi:YesN/AraC family two-component response regulator